MTKGTIKTLRYPKNTTKWSLLLCFCNVYKRFMPKFAKRAPRWIGCWGRGPKKIWLGVWSACSSGPTETECYKDSDTCPPKDWSADYDRNRPLQQKGQLRLATASKRMLQARCKKEKTSSIKNEEKLAVALWLPFGHRLHLYQNFDHLHYTVNVICPVTNLTKWKMMYLIISTIFHQISWFTRNQNKQSKGLN